jgi:CubicO group peptidase (beta-lactamase class C family)
MGRHRTVISALVLVLVLVTLLGPVPARTGLAQDAAPAALTDDRRAEFETYVDSTLAMMRVPGAAVAVVQGGEVVYLDGFGVKELGVADPVTPDTLMRVASVTKPVTTTMTATLVDDGRVGWDTPVVELLPNFALADPELTRRLTVADLFCACSGVPNRDAELGFNSFSLTPERLIASAPDFPLTAPFGERYQYNNQMFTIGGYAAAAAAGGGPNNLYDAYALAMRERVLNPIEMERSTFSLADVLADGDYAVSHVVNLAGETHPLALLEDQSIYTAEAPAGALWSSAREMARYVQTQLAGGLAPDGRRVVSRENLERTWESQMVIPAEAGGPPVLNEMLAGYGLGWFVGEYRGQRVLSHGGTAFGFTAEIAFLPEDDLGLVVLTNGPQVGTAYFFTQAIKFRLLELLFDQTPEIDPFLPGLLADLAAETAQVLARLGPVDPSAVAPYLGGYSNPALGEVVVTLRGNRLLFDAGELWFELRPLAGEEATYLFYDGPLGASTDTVTFLKGTAGRPAMVMAVTEAGEALSYTFDQVAPVATPP